MVSEQSSGAPACLDDVLITGELARRPARAPDFAAENRALTALALEMANQPHRVLQKLAELVVELCHADSAGISILEPGGEHGVFRWHAVSGPFAVHLGGTLPHDHSPCGVVVARGAVQLFDGLERCFPELAGVTPRLHESLLAPWNADSEAVGTVWAIAHSPGRHFDAEDARVLQSLATHAAAAYRMGAALADAHENRRALEQRVEERTRLLTEANARLQHEVEGRRQVEAAQRESEARFRALADASPALIWQVDDAGRAVYFNQRYLDVVGLLQEQLLGHGWHAVLHPDDLHAYLGTVREALRAHAPWQRRVRIRVRDDGWHPFDAHGAPWFGADGHFRGHVGVCIDISATVQTEDALKDADRRKDEFLATLAHELRNPLAPISNAVHLLRHPDGRRAADRMVEMIERQVRQMVRLVNDLMDVSRITRGKIGLSKAQVALADILASAIETSQPAIDNAHHAFTVSLPAEPLMLQADKVRLTQVFANLLNNAAKYTDRGGRIWLGAHRDGDMAVVSVRDNGTGIDAAALPHVFEMFAQAHAPSDRHQGGLGIGLTMVRNLVHLHGGTVEAQSAGSGMGSEFVVRLPLRAQGAAASGPGEAAPPGAVLAGRRVLVVDDNRDAADSLCLLLKTAGATVEVRYDGLAALAALEESGPNGFDAMVLDIGMPGMDGHTVAHRVRQGGRHPGMKIIALTGWGQQVDRARSHTNGIDHHLTKPVDWKVLVNLLAAG